MGLIRRRELGNDRIAERCCRKQPEENHRRTAPARSGFTGAGRRLRRGGDSGPALPEKARARASLEMRRGVLQERLALSRQ